jgi:hypothetical protein
VANLQLSLYTPNDEVRWGKHSKYGEQILYVDDIAFLDSLNVILIIVQLQQVRMRELQINEQLKEKLGIDWLEECRIRRESERKN